jgi:hypothetical protein
MSEETQVPTPETNTQETPNAETPALDVNTTVKVGDQEVPVSELVSGYQKLGDLEEYKKNASMLVKNTPMSPEDRNKAMRYILEKEGYAPSQIDEQLRATQAMYDTDEQNEPNEQYEEPQYAPEPQATPESPSGVDEEARDEIARMKQQNNKLQVDMLKRDLGESMQRVMNSNDSVRKLFDKSKELAGEEGFAERAAGIQSEIQRIALENMRSRRNSGERFDKSWFDQETNKAADTVYQRIRSVIGDPDKIQRAPETASDVESFISKPPVADPTYERGDNMGTSTDKSHDFTVDALSRLAADLGMGGESRI